MTASRTISNPSSDDEERPTHDASSPNSPTEAYAEGGRGYLSPSKRLGRYRFHHHKPPLSLNTEEASDSDNDETDSCICTIL